jgi:four helix bundle protein
MVEKLEDLRVYQRAVRYWNAVYSLFRRPGFRRDRKLREQVESANDSIKANIAEGFEQGTDAMFIRYLEYAKGSLAEVVSRLGDARAKGYITAREHERFADEAARIFDAIGKLIQYLDGCDWKDRGRHQARLRTAGSDKAAITSKRLSPTCLPTSDGPPDPATGD